MTNRVSTIAAAFALTLSGAAQASLDLGFSIPQCSLTGNPLSSSSCGLAVPSMRFCYTLEVFRMPGGGTRTRQTGRICDAKEPTGNVRVVPKG